MNTVNLWGFCIALVVSLIATGIVRRYALHANLLDFPNKRSSHEIATPRGGGLAIALVFLGGLLILFLLNFVPGIVFLSIFSGGFLIAGIGFADDHTHVPARWRSAVHFFAAATALVLLGGLPAIQFGTTTVDLGIVGDILAVVFIVWMINLYNFMDGIDGIAAVEAFCIAGSAFVILSVSDSGYISILLLVFVATALGFLVWNWPPAKVFMGDVGSGFIGFILAMFAIISSSLGLLPIWIWLILAGVFVVDATVTLITRVINGEEWYSAHNNHAYQKASRRLKSHKPVTLSVLVINILWLLPMAWFASARPEFGWWLAIIAWMPLISLSLFLKAGHPEPSAQGGGRRRRSIE